jgi:L-iditol 2-dehydrogenase
MQAGARLQFCLFDHSLDWRPTMKAAMLVGVRKYEVRELPDPRVPEDGVLVRVKACGVCGSDIRRWKEGPAAGAPLVIAGHEIAGEVIGVGPNCSGYALGDRMAVCPDVHCGRCYYCKRGMFNLCDSLTFIGNSPGRPGGFANLLPLSGEILTNGIVSKMPEGMDYLAASLAEPCMSVLMSHDRANTGLDDTVVVIGAGPIGCIHVAVARARGARVILSGTREVRRRMAKRFEPDAILDPETVDVVEWVRQATEGRGADIVICANPVADTQAQAVQMVRKGGRVVLFGGLPKANPMVTLDANRIHYGEISVVGAFSYVTAYQEKALRLIANATIPADKLITRTFPLEQVAEAFEEAASGNALKVVVTI